MMSRILPYGTKAVDGVNHLVLDIDLWKKKFPLNEDNRSSYLSCVDRPVGLALIEQTRDALPCGTNLGPSVETDVFVWATSNKHGSNSLTKIGGAPWREPRAPWPKDADGLPLQFIAQINFSDSKDLIPFELPGDILLLFARWDGGYVHWDLDSIQIEWSKLDIVNPTENQRIPPNGQLAFCHHGVIHRIKQYCDFEQVESLIEDQKTAESYFDFTDIQAASIGTHARIPQGWPFEYGDGNRLLCVFSTHQFSGEWPLCDIEQVPYPLRADGSFGAFSELDALSTLYADAGVVYVYRNNLGEFKCEMVC
jgi:Domain of unknown function (DUF1963)